MRNWKTSAAGIVLICNAVIGIVQHFIDGTPIDTTQHTADVAAGIGLLCAKDFNVTGGK